MRWSLFPFIAVTLGCAGSDGGDGDDDKSATATTGDTAVAGESDAEDSDEPQGACGGLTRHTVRIRGLVVDGADKPVKGASVQLEESNWSIPTEVWGKGQRTDAKGAFDFEAERVINFERGFSLCLSYALVVTQGERSVEEPVNQPLSNAMRDGDEPADYDMDLSKFPIVLQ